MLKKRYKIAAGAVILGGAGLAILNFDSKEAPQPENKPLPPVALLTKVDAQIYGQNNALLGVLDKGSCVVAQPPFKDDASGFRTIEVKTSQGAVYGTVSARLLTDQGAGTVENCKADIRPVLADPAKPETKDLPQAQTYTVTSSIPLYFDTISAPSGLFLEKGSCLSLMSEGHTDTMFHVLVSDAKRVGDVYVFRNTVEPLGNYDWEKGCNAIITGTMEKNRPEATIKPVEGQPAQTEEKPEANKADTVPEKEPVITPATPTETAQDKPLEIRNGRLYIVTADQLNLRSGPGADYASLNTIFKDSCVQALGTKRNADGFIHVLTSYDQKQYQKGYVSQEYLKPAPQNLDKMQCFIK